MRARIAIAVAACTACAAPAQADAPWTNPVRVQGGENAYAVPAFGTGGQGIAIWPRGRSTFGATFRPDGSFGPAIRLASGFTAYKPGAIGPRGGMVVVGSTPYRARGARRANGSRIAVAYGRVGGRLGRPRALFPPVGNGYAVSAGNTSGDVVVAGWVSRASPVRSARRWIYVAARRAGGSFSRAQRVARYPKRGRAPSIAVALTENGRALIAWAVRGRIYVRERSARGRLGSAQLVGRATRTAFDSEPSLSARLVDDGHAVVGWADQPLYGESPVTEPGVIKVAARLPAGNRFAAPVQLEEVRPATGPGGVLDSSRVASPPQLRPLGPGRMLLAWDGQDGNRPVVRVAPLDGTTVGPVETLRRPGASAGAGWLATGLRGEAVVVWRELQAGMGVPGGEHSTLLAAVRAPDAQRFGEPEVVADAVPLLGGAAVAVDPVTTRPVALWSQFAQSAQQTFGAARAPIVPAAG